MYASAGAAYAGECPPGVDPTFTEVAVAAGIDFEHSGFMSYMPVFMMSSGGVAGDFDNDGWQDLFVMGTGSRPDALYMNNGDGTFTDRAAEAGLARRHFGVGVAAADYDKDGDLDLYITSHSADVQSGEPTPSVGRHRLFRNNGDGTFTNVAKDAGVETVGIDSTNGWSPAWGDYDNDGILDLAVAGWFTDTVRGSRLFRGNGDGTFTDVTTTAGVSAIDDTHGFTPRFVDMDGDFFPELIWTADFLTSLYFINNADGTFTEHTAAAGVGIEINGMGTTVADFNYDGKMDWYATSIDRAPEPAEPGGPRPEGYGNMLYLNNGDHTYTESSDQMGVSAGFWGWGTDAIDFNHDGFLDIAETNGWNISPWVDNPACLFIANGDGTYREGALTNGFVHEADGRGLLTFDYDNDGDRDVVIFTRSGRLHLFRNDTAPSACRSWLSVSLDTSANAALAPHGLNARIRVTAGDLVRHGVIQAATNFLAQSELSSHFGLAGATTVDEILVEWPDGSETIMTDVAINQRVSIAAPSPCAADINNDGSATAADFTAWLFIFNNQTTSSPSELERADVNEDGSITSADFTAWLDAFSNGCA